MKHTQGPWHVTEWDDVNFCNEKVGYIAQAAERSDLYEKHVAKIMTWGEPFTDSAEAQANAKLLAAAPDLLAALQAVMQERQALPANVAQQARAALAKATA